MAVVGRSAWLYWCEGVPVGKGRDAFRGVLSRRTPSPALFVDA